jgi:hypothetical protein
MLLWDGNEIPPLDPRMDFLLLDFADAITFVLGDSADGLAWASNSILEGLLLVLLALSIVPTESCPIDPLRLALLLLPITLRTESCPIDPLLLLSIVLRAVSCPIDPLLAVEFRRKLVGLFRPFRAASFSDRLGSSAIDTRRASANEGTGGEEQDLLLPPSRRRSFE